MKKLFTILFLVIPFSLLISQVAPDKYWVKFTDKSNTPYSINNPEDFLSQRAIDRRNSQGIAIIENDLPVDPAYIAAVENTGATLLNVSKWFNSVTIFTDDPAVLTAINSLPFVMSVDAIGSSAKLSSSEKPFFENETYETAPQAGTSKNLTSGDSYNYGSAFNQINMLNGIALHNLGFDGEGVVIAVLDAGFLNVDVNDAFDSLWNNNQIRGYKDFVDPQNPNIFNSHYHGAMVLSTMGANLPGEMVGTAPKADYWLLRTEDGGTEYLIEELNWVSGAEFADSAGADIINSSLGYTEFDDASQDHTYQDMDGNTTPITIGADLAASKGILVVNSAGNSGNDAWMYIGAPADGDSVFSIGAVNSLGSYVSFSSKGPTYDGRVKPNVVAQGSSSAIISPYTGNVSTGSGTSFASPITAGMVACLWQAHPGRKNTEIMAAIEQSGSQANNPDDLMGYGIPDYFAAHSTLNATMIHTVNLNVKLYLEGPFNGSSMNSNLNPILPLDQPYNIAPFNYAGTEQVTSIPGSDIVDWIMIELRDTSEAVLASAETTIARRAAFIKSDGNIVDLDGISPVSFAVPISDSLLLVIRHRNHLGVISSFALQENGSNTYSYDFSTGANKVYGGESGYKEIAPGIYGMVAGDANTDGTINETDKILSWSPDAGTAAYLPGDFNLDSQIDNRDKDECWVTNQTFLQQIPE